MSVLCTDTCVYFIYILIQNRTSPLIIIIYTVNNIINAITTFQFTMDQTNFVICHLLNDFNFNTFCYCLKYKKLC